MLTPHCISISVTHILMISSISNNRDFIDFNASCLDREMKETDTFFHPW